MLLGTFLGMVIALYFNQPITPVLVFGTISQCFLAYGLTKNQHCLNFGLCIVGVQVANFVTGDLVKEAQTTVPGWMIATLDFLRLPAVMNVYCIVVLLIVSAIGILGFGPGFSRHEKQA